MGEVKIRYYSTNRSAPSVGFREALMNGLAPDGGLYMPDSIPFIGNDELFSWRDSEYWQIAFNVIREFLGNEIDEMLLRQICMNAYIFDIPIEKVYGRKYVLRLDQGPTASFKDFAARLMARLIHYYVTIENRQLTILTATSGDTGSAVASAFRGLSGIDVVILFPLNEVSAMQRKQMTTLHGNITVIGIDGKFDDCQKMAKLAFGDESLRGLRLSSANSINIGRLIPQSVYYLYAWSRLAQHKEERITFSVPSGNFGNLMGGILAREMGMPVRKFVIATNSNDEVPEFLKNGVYKPIVPSVNCISNAMNVGHPSNFSRIVEIYKGIMDETGKIIKDPDLKSMRIDFHGECISDEETKLTISDCYRNHNVLLEPHGSVAWKGLQNYLTSVTDPEVYEDLCVSLETAHPAKFPDEISRAIGITPDFPPSLAEIKSGEEKYFLLENDYSCLRKFLLNNFNN